MKYKMMELGWISAERLYRSSELDAHLSDGWDLYGSPVFEGGTSSMYQSIIQREMDQQESRHRIKKARLKAA